MNLEGLMVSLYLNFHDSTKTIRPHPHPLILFGQHKPGYIAALVTSNRSSCGFCKKIQEPKCKCSYNRQLPDIDRIFRKRTCIELNRVIQIEISQELLNYISINGKKINTSDYNYIIAENRQFKLENAQMETVNTTSDLKMLNYALNEKSRVI